MTPLARRLTRILEKARRIESTIAGRVEGAVGRVTGAPMDRQPIELAQAVVEEVAREVQPTGRGRRGFPFNQVRVSVLAPNARARAQLQAVLEGAHPLRERIAERLSAAGCPTAGLFVKVSFVTKARAGWTQPDFHVECSRVDAAELPDMAVEPRLELVVLAGTTGRPTHTFGASAVAIGRGAEVCDSRGRLIRTNHVAFTEGDDINQTVSRLHARIERESGAAVYRIFDDGSAQGTSVIRGGRGYAVPRGTRGMTLVAGDELVIGRARLKVKSLR